MHRYVTIGGIFALLSIAFGAFGAHALEDKLSMQALETFHTGVQYQMYHGIALVLTALLSKQASLDQKRLHWAGVFFVIGVVLFSGSLYMVSLAGISKFGIVAPFGGVSMMLGWLLLILSIRKHSKQ